jgi:hypothetical protein
VIENVTIKDASDAPQPIGADKIGSDYYQVVKLAFGADGVLQLVDATGLPVAIVGTVPVSGPLTNDELRASDVLVALNAASLAALENITVGGTVELGGTSLAALESVTATGPLTEEQLRDAPVSTQEATTGTHYQPGFDVAGGVGAGGALRTDPDGNLVTRAQVLTDELGYRANFANSSLAVAIGTATFTNGSRIVTGTGFIAADLRTDDHCKLDADAESAWAQIESLDSDTQLTLLAPYTGTGGTGASSRTILKPVTGAGGAIAVASGVCTITAGTTAGAITEVERDVDWLPLVKQAGVAVSQRIANQGTYVGFYDESAPTAPKHFAWFLLDGTVNTTVKCQSARNPTTAPSASEIEETIVTLPNGATSATSRRYRVEVLGDRVVFYIDSVLVATHFRSMPGPGDLLTSTVRVLNGTTPASSTTVTIDYDTVKNHNKLEVGLLSDSEQVVAVQPPAQMFSYTAGAVVIPINTDLLVIDCSQFRSLSILAGTVGTTGVVTGAWSNDPSFTDALTATLLSETGASSTTFTGAAAQLRTTPVRARYFRLRMTTATTAAGATRINVAAFQADISAAIVTQPVSGTVALSANTPTLAAGTNRAGFVAGAGIWFDDSSTNLGASATFTGTSRDATVTATATAFANAATYAQEVRLSAESDVTGTLWLEVSRDNTNWRRAKSVPTAAVTGGGFYAEIVHRPSWRYWRAGYTNGAGAQARFALGSVATAI